MKHVQCTPESHIREVIHFGQTNFRSQQTKFGIRTDDRRRHMYIIGKTGMGKSTLLENMIIQDIRRGHGLAVADPHGDLVETILDFIPSHRINDVIYFNPSDIDYPIAFNILESVEEPHERNLVASGLVAVFKKMWADSWGPRLEYLLRNAILALLDYPGATLLGVTRMMIDKEFRKKVVVKIKDPVVKTFWLDEYTKYSTQFQVEAISPIQNKVGQFLSMSMIRNIIGQVKSSIDIRDIMDNNKILLLNLSKGRMGEDASALLGATMITKMQLAAMSRVDMNEQDRQDFYLYVDEFQNFATDSFANILSEARKYRLNLIMAHQYVEQLSETVSAAVFGNVGTLITYRIGATDAEFLAKEFVPTFDETDLVNLAKYDFYLKLMIDGVTSDPFSATGLMPIIAGPREGHRDKVIAVSRERYASERTVIEDKIARWSGVQMVETDPKAPVTRDEDGFKSNCSNCKKETYTKFEPDGVRPIFCADCLQLFKDGKLDRDAAIAKAKKENQQARSKQGGDPTKSVSSSNITHSQKSSPQKKSSHASKSDKAKHSPRPAAPERTDTSRPLSQAEVSLAEALSAMSPVNFNGNAAPEKNQSTKHADKPQPQEKASVTKTIGPKKNNQKITTSKQSLSPKAKSDKASTQQTKVSASNQTKSQQSGNVQKQPLVAKVKPNTVPAQEEVAEISLSALRKPQKKRVRSQAHNTQQHENKKNNKQVLSKHRVALAQPSTTNTSPPKSSPAKPAEPISPGSTITFE